MPHDAPAALPLLAYTLGLAFGTSLTHPRGVCAAVVAASILAARLPLLARRRFRVAATAIAFACGVMMSLHVQAVRAREATAFAALPADQFVTVTAPLDHGWTARSGGSFSLRASRFEIGGRKFAAPLQLYTRFAPARPRFAERVVAQGFLKRDERGFYTMTIKSPLLLEYHGELAMFSPTRWNRALNERLETLADLYPIEAGLMEALALGRGERLDENVRESFRRGGTYHLLVFSGLQIALAAGLLAWLLRALHAPRASDWLLLAFAVLAPAFIGAAASVSRASAGIGLYALSRIAKRPTSLENLWCVAALTQLVLVPRDIAEAAFHLTYAGAGALLFVAKVVRRHRWLAAAIAAEITIVPLTLLHFHQYAAGGSVATAVMTPVIFAMLLVSVAACAFPVPLLAELMAGLHLVCSRINAAAAVSSGFFAAPPRVAIVAAGFAAVAAIALTRGRERALLLVVALLMPSAAAVGRHISARRFDGVQAIALDVGQGDAVLVRSREAVMLVDGGGRADAPRFGETTLLPLLADRGVSAIDVVVLTHAHPDHCGGLPSVLEHHRVGSLWLSPRKFSGPCATALLEASIRRRIPIHLVRDGDRIALPSIHAAAMLAPIVYRRASQNNCSVVLRVQAERRRLLLTGDVERETESSLLDQLIRADVLKVAHHGSRSSSADAFLDAVAPRAAIISAGRNNLFGHPSAEVLERLRMRRIVIWRTDRQGTVSISLRGMPITVATEIDTPR